MRAVCFEPATRLAAQIRARTLSCRELMERCLAQIERVNPALNAVVQLQPERARRAADRADAALARGDPIGALHGVPMTLKDSLDTAGWISTWGTPGRSSFVPPSDATVVTRLRAAGAILIGKTNTPELTMSFETDNAIYGPTRNPYALECSPGGSSGGSAAIVASGGSAFDVGSDTGGSIRLPCHFCGVAGLKPTSGRVPRTGHAIGPYMAAEFLTQLGPIARRVEDLWALLKIIAGPDGSDPAVAPVPLKDPAQLDFSNLRVAYHTNNGIRAASSEVAEVVHAAADALAAAGVRVTEARPAGIEHALDCYQLAMGADGGASLRLVLERWGTELADSTLRYLTENGAPSAGVRARIDERIGEFRSQMNRFFIDFDAILCPPNATAATGHGAYRENYDAYAYTMAFNLTGWPAAVVRAGTSAAGLPIGVQLVAPAWREDIVLRLATSVEEALGGWQEPPGFEPSAPSGG